jgi:hypothetical protein
MKTYIWEKAFERTWKSAKWDEYSNGLIEIATFIRLSGGETVGIYHGYTGELNSDDEKEVSWNHKLNPAINFYAKDAPYVKYVDEPSILDRLVEEKGVTAEQYTDWLNLEETRTLIQEAQSKASETDEWKTWKIKNQTFFESLSALAKEFNEANKQFLPFSIRVYHRESDEMLTITLHNEEINIDRDTVQKELPSEKRKEIVDRALKVCDAFGEFLKNKFSQE